ncbi:cytochrome P450 [Actinomycetospora sp. NBRC 106378]|uniref:cytochrome P450 n=1 Tax=Actinomycetospora sp. NBRC 106378 TaxID=3032208 RepID=UPI0024A5540D|nr:cytochrome P450 [Actinomycetospora sp. NBRC 106378]GLZ55873.1 cytochrome P450 [Actinomycetospora sp. NBRC 106378]
MTSTVLHGLPTARDAGPFDPPQAITRARETAPVAPVRCPDGHTSWLVTGYDEVRRVLADVRFSSRLDLGVLHVPYETPGMPAPTEPSPTVPGLFIAMDPPEQSRLRRKLAGAFTVRRMAQLEDAVAAVVEHQLDEMERRTPPVDLVETFAVPVPTLVICDLLGVPAADRDDFRAHAARFLLRDITLEDKAAAFGAMTTYLGQLVTSKRADPGDDVLSDLARHDDLTLEELTGCAFLLLLAGHETSANLLALGTFALLEHPDQADALRADPGLVPNAVDDLLRHLSVVDILYRYATEDLELGGETIPAGSTVVLSLLAANRDPRHVDDPDVLDLHRTTRGSLSFGHGVHQCLGHQLARIELQAGFAGLLRRFPTLRLAVDAAEVPLRTDMQIYGVHELPVAW